MNIKYKKTKVFTVEELQGLFLSVEWESGNYPEKLVRALDDGQTIAFLHYLLVDPAYQGLHIGDELMKQIMSCFEDILYVKVMPSDPKTIPFYERYGFQQYDNYSAMVRKHFV